MSIKRIIAFILSLLMIYGGGYIAFFGIQNYLLYSGVERDFDNMEYTQLQPNLNIKGYIRSLDEWLLCDSIPESFLGFPLYKGKQRNYYMIQLVDGAPLEQRKYCVVAISGDDDLKAAEALLDDPSAPPIEFRGIVLPMSDAVYKKLKERLEEIYDTDFNIYMHANVSKYIVPYQIRFKQNTNDDYLMPVIAGTAAAIAGLALFIVLSVSTYRKKHMYD